MKVEKIEYEHAGATLEAHLAYDETKQGKRPFIFIFHAWRGRDEFVCKKAEWLAELGYVGCALDIYGKGVLGTSVEENSKLMEPFIEDRQLLRDRMWAGMEATQTHSAGDPSQLGAIGFCFGGLCALDLARSGAPLKGAVSFHGLLGAPEKLKSKAIQAKLLVLHGHDDPMVPPEQVLAFEQEMTEAKVDWQVHAYGQTAHAFTNPAANDPKLGTIYSEIAEKRSLKAMENFFAEIYQ